MYCMSPARTGTMYQMSMELLCDTFLFPRDATTAELEDLIASRKEELASFARQGSGDARTEYLKLVAYEHRWRLRRPLVREPVEREGGNGVALDDFPPVTLDERCVPREAFVPLVTHSYYSALHAHDAAKFPLSQTVFRNRHEIYTRGASFMGNNDVWCLDILCTPQLHTDPQTGRRCVHAMIINEKYEPRWGTFFCTDSKVNRRTYEWQQDLTQHSVPVFIRLAGSHGMRYCGEWSFERLTTIGHDVPFCYVEGQRDRLGVFRVTLASYDARWGSFA